MPRRPRTSGGPSPSTGWQKKVHPFFVKTMSGYEEIEQLSKSPWKEDHVKAQQLVRNPPEELRKEARQLGEQLRKENPNFRKIVTKIFDLDLENTAISDISDEAYMLSWLSWNKYQKTWRQLQYERNTGNRTASKRILAVLADYEKWKFSELNPNKMSFKIHRLHFNFMAHGLNFGLDTLSPDELADCFDALCSCGIQQHDPENLRKLRTNILKALDKLDGKAELLKSGKD